MKRYSDFGIDVGNATQGNVKVFCPKCRDKRKPEHKHDKPLSVNLNQMVWHCFNCDFSGTLKEYERDVKKYSYPVAQNFAFSEKVGKYFLSRGISEYTLQRFKIGSKKISQDREVVMFPFYEKDVLVNIKYRDAQKKFWLEKDAKLVFFGMDVSDENSKDEVIICEGEVDALSFYEAGLKNCVSVPNGASKGNSQLEYLNVCYDFINSKSRVIIATDNDEAGQALGKELIRRIGSDKCWTVNFEDCKDANEILVKHGKDRLKEIISLAKPCPIKGIALLDDVEEELDDLFNNGLSKPLEIGFDCLDQLIRFEKGDLTVVTGVPSHGKSNFLNQILVLLAAKHGWKFGIFSPEYKISRFIAQLESIFIGKSFFAHDSKMTIEQHSLAKNFVRDHFFFFKHEDLDDITVTGLLAKAKETILRHGISGFVFDPWNYIDHLYGKSQNETQYIGEALTEIKRFKDKYNVHFWIVAHPKKMSKESNGEYVVPTPYDINGSANFFNKSDWCMCVYRQFQIPKVVVYIQRVRDTWYGQVGSSEFDFDKYTRRYKETNMKNYISPVQFYMDRLGLTNEYGLEPIPFFETEKTPWD